MIDIEKSSHNVMDVTVYALTMQEVLQWAKEGMKSPASLPRPMQK